MGSNKAKSQQTPQEAEIETTGQKADDKKETLDAGGRQTPVDGPSEIDGHNAAGPRPGMRGSWYTGSWRTKSSALTSTARESIHADTSDQSKSFPTSEAKLRRVDGTPSEAESKRSAAEGPPIPPEPLVTDDAKSIASSTKVPSAWLGGWWSRPDGYASDSEKAKGLNKRRRFDDTSSSTPLPLTPNSESEQDVSKPAQGPSVPRTDGGTDNKEPNAPLPEMTARSWFKLWSSEQNQQQEVDKSDPNDMPVLQQAAEVAATGAAQSLTSKPDEKDDKDVKHSDDKPTGEDRPSSSGWAFWSYDRPKDAVTTPGGTQKQLGELAVADTPSQSHPEAAQFNEQQGSKIVARDAASLRRPKRSRLEKVANTSSTATLALGLSREQSPAESPPSETLELPKPARRGKQPSKPNIVAPTFTGMYPVAPSPSSLERWAKYLAQSFGIQGQPPPSHVFSKTTNFPKIKKAIAIGVHGFFPAPMLQRVLGPPTGTSIRFANEAAAAIAEWCQENQPEIKEVDIEKVALEGEGLIADRVNLLWKLVLNWLSHLRQADFVLVACHSQGVPVSISLLRKLIQLGVLKEGAKIGVCAMAGINLGPFPEYRSSLLAGTALELFSFCSSSSKNSQAYVEALEFCLRAGVRISYIGSLDDQLVSLESSLFAPLSHPYVHRAIFIDGRLHSPSFLTHLVIFALKLRNLGVSDHGLLRELSAPVAGSLVGGEGHSRIYDDLAVYRLAVDFVLQSTDVDPATFKFRTASAHDKGMAHETAIKRRSSMSGFPVSTAAANSIRRGSMSAAGNLPGVGAVIAPYQPLVSGANSNPFFLPWAVRGMLEEEMVKQEMRDEVTELVSEFEDWKPTIKGLKDVKWRLEAVRNMI